MIKLLDFKKNRKKARWRKEAFELKHDLAHDLPLAFWSSPDESYIDFFIKKGGNPISNIYVKKTKALPTTIYMNPIHEVARNNPNPNVLKKLIDYAGEMDFFETLTGQLPIGYSAAHERYARPRQHFVENAIVLLENGTNLMKVYTEFNTCTIHAVVTATEEYEFLLDACLQAEGAAEIPFGGKIVPNQTPLAIAAGAGRLWACKKLVDFGAHIEGKNGDLPPVTCCISSLGKPWIADFRNDEGVYSCLEYLIRSGARREVNFPGINWKTNEWLENVYDIKIRKKVYNLFHGDGCI